MRILLVCGWQKLADDIKPLLEAEGCEVIVRPNNASAWHLFRHSEATFDGLVILAMPNNEFITWETIIRMARAYRPNLTCVALVSVQAWADSAKKVGATPILQGFFKAEAFLEEFRSAFCVAK